MNLSNIRAYGIHGLALIAFLITTSIFFYPQLQGKTLRKNDIMHWEGMRQEVKDFKEKTGESSLWTGSMFSGMPTYYIQTYDNSNMIKYVIKIMKLGMGGEFGRFLLGMICFYILMLVLRIDPTIGIFGSILFAFTTNNLVLLGAGHFTKISTILSSPLIIAGVVSAYRNKNLLGLVLFGIGMAINLKSDHPQMTYYLGLIMIIYVSIALVNAIKEKTLKSFIKSSMYLGVGLVLALGSFSSKLLPTLEYSSDTMRGKPILTASNNQTSSSSQVEGLEWGYATAWSNGWMDLLSSFIPQAVGGSSAEPISSDSKFARELRRRGQSTRGDIRGPMYWGELPGTSGPIYFGAVVFLLFFIGLVIVNSNLKWWILGGTLLTFLISLGHNLEWFNRLLFDYLPVFNKFRTPNSVLSVTAIIIPLLAMILLNKILSDETINYKKVFYSGLGITGFCIIIGLVGPMIFDFSSNSDAQYAQYGFDQSIFEDDRASLLRTSSFRSAFLMLLTLGTLFLFSKSKINKILAIVIIGLLAIADQFAVNLNYMTPDDYISRRNFEESYAPRAVDKQILQDPDLHYRVLDQSVNTFNSSFASFFHKSIGGYHAAKLQRYDDIINYHIMNMNQNVLNMLNMKYRIFKTGQETPEQVQRNTAALGNAWYVNNIKMVDSADDEIAQLIDFDPRGTAVVHNEYNDYVSGLNSGQKNGSIKLQSYKPNELVYQSSSSSEQLAVFSEVWYGPNKGWNAYIDGKKIEHIRANYILRALRIPAGNHEIKFVFAPASYSTGSIISLICSSLLILILAFFFWRVYAKGWQNVDIL